MTKEDSACQDIPKQQLPEYYLQHRPLQPKLEIANYVEEQGILVPRRFESLQQALASKQPFIIRSEHPQDYDGVSGLIVSYVIDDETFEQAFTRCRDKIGFDIDWESVDNYRGDLRVIWNAQDQLIAQVNSMSQHDFEAGLVRVNMKYIKTYAKYMGIDPNDFLKDLSYSYWEYIDGYNRTVIGDSAINDRFHVFTKRDKKDDHTYKYCIVENGQIIYKGPSYSGEFPTFLEEGVLTAIDTYQQVIKLDRFNPQQRPIIEMQGPVDNPQVNFFLQYHRGTKFEPSLFILDREPKKDEIEATFCRGATNEEGEVFTTYFPSIINFDTAPQDGGCDCHKNYIYSEVMVGRRRMQLMSGDMDRIAENSDSLDHMARSQLFKPPLTVVVPELRALEPTKDEREAAKIKGVIPSSQLYVTADGRRALIRRVG